MSNPNKRRGSDLEREIVNIFKTRDLVAKRAYESNGESLGLDKEVDVVVTICDVAFSDNKLKIQAKRKKQLPKWLGMTNRVDSVCVKEDRGDIYIMFRLKDFIDRFL